MKEEWLLAGAAVPVTCETVTELVLEIKRLIDVVGGMALARPEPDWDALAEKQLASLKHDMRASLEDAAVRATHKMMAELEQEPVAWMVYTQEGQSAFVTDNPSQIHPSQRALPLYATPQRPWVGLTDAEIKEIVGPWGDTPVKGYTRKLFDQIEAKLKEKNND